METIGQNKTLNLKDGRKLGYSVYGVPGGKVVFYFHGSGSSRLEHPFPDDILIRLNICFICMDRPGNGLSDFQPNRRLLDCPIDLVQLADYLRTEQFYVIGHSAGGPHTLACAHQIPERVKAGAIISSVAPMSRPNAFQGMPVLNQILAKSSRSFPILVYFIRWMTRKMVMGDFEKASKQLMSSIPESDKVILYNSGNIEHFVRSIQEGFRTGSKGVAQDDILVNKEWGFDLTGITPRIEVWHGEADVNVPFGAGKYLAESIPNARATFLEGEGHFFILKYWERILSELVIES